MEDIIDSGEGINKRNDFRVYFHKPVCTKISIIRYKNEKIKTGFTRVCVNDIGIGGLLFTTKLKFKVSLETIFLFQLRILNEELSIEGVIVREIKSSNEINKYGVKLLFNKDDESYYFQLFNRLDLLVKKNDIRNYLYYCDFCTRNEFPC